MARDRLVVNEERGVYQIAWFLAEEQDIGAALGECGTKPEAPTNEHEAAEAAVWGMADGSAVTRSGLYWETSSGARAALAVAKAAVAQFNSKKPWPEWTKHALAAGWKAPRGWTP